jgi:glycolate oxidase FAD binding subunit
VHCIGVEGAPQETQWQIDTLKTELAPFTPREIDAITDEAAKKLWFALTEFQVSSEELGTFQANLLPSRTIEFAAKAEELGVTVQAHAASGIVLGHLPDRVSSVETAREILDPLRTLARTARGNLVVLNCDTMWKRELPLFGDSEPSWPLMKKLKQELDPRGLLNPGRFI